MVEICQRLDGVPLAIELAAARVIALSPADLFPRLDRRFHVLAGGRRGAVERHATLRAAIDWSDQLLTPAEQRLLARLSVFSGGCTLEAVEEVCGGDPVDPDDVMDLVTSLVSRSLVVAEDGVGHSSACWRPFGNTARKSLRSGRSPRPSRSNMPASTQT